MAILENAEIASYLVGNFAAQATTGGLVIGHWLFILLRPAALS
jgi:hypothetical protein